MAIVAFARTLLILEDGLEVRGCKSSKKVRHTLQARDQQHLKSVILSTDIDIDDGEIRFVKSKRKRQFLEQLVPETSTRPVSFWLNNYSSIFSFV